MDCKKVPLTLGLPIGNLPAVKSRRQNQSPHGAFTLLELIVVLAVIGGIVWGIAAWRGNKAKAKQQALLQQQQEEKAAALRQAEEERAAKKQRELVAEKVKEATALLDLYGTAIGGLAHKADEAVQALQKEANSPAAQDVKRRNSALAARVMAQQVTETYGNWQKLLGRMTEHLADTQAINRVEQLSYFANKLDDGATKTAFQNVVAACKGTREALDKYQSRYRTDVEEQLEQLKGCAATVLPTIAALTAARKQIDSLGR